MKDPSSSSEKPKTAINRLDSRSKEKYGDRKMKEYQLIIIGGGPAGLAAAVAARDKGIKDILILEREKRPGGILRQCIHNGFGLQRFKESLTGPEYANKFIAQVDERGIEYMTETTVLSFGKDKTVLAVNPEEGVMRLKAKAIILAMGCRERSRGALNIAGSRGSGIYSAGAAQKFVNISGYMPGKRIVILGSGDIGLIMARRMTLEGAKVLAVAEIMPYSSGLKRNIKQCLDDFDIPLYLSHTITEIRGDKRVSGVTISRVDENRRPIKGTEISFDCDTVLFSVGLIPENELTKNAGIELSPGTRGAVVYDNRETLTEGVFACGNVLHVHDLVDFVSEESELAGRSAADYILNGEQARETAKTVNGANVGYVLPQLVNKNAKPFVKLFFRVRKEIRNARIVIKSGDVVLSDRTKKIVVPGEMETAILTDKMLEAAGAEICVEVTENV